MPGVAQGLGRALRRAAREGAKEALVRRPGEVPPPKPELGGPKPPPTPAESPPRPTVEPLETPEPLQATERPTEPVATLDPVKPAAPAVEPLPPIPDEVVDETATRLARARLADYALDETHQPNFETINTTDDIKATIADVSNQNAGRIDEARRGTITNEQLQGLAEDLDINEDIVRAVMERESGGILNAETILAARQVLNSSAERLQSLAQQVHAGQATDMDRLRFRRQLQWHSEYQTQFMGARAEAGRALNAFRIPAGADIDAARMREMVDVVNGYDTDQVAAAIAMMDNTSSVSQAARKYTQSRIMGTVNELFINSILSGPKTHVVNTAGNVLMQMMTMSETAVAARLGRFLSGAEHVQVGEASALMHGTISAWRDGLRLAARSMRTGTALDDVVKFESTRRRSISAEHLLTPEQRDTPLGRFTEALLDGVRIPVRGTDVPVPGVGQVIRAPTERVMIPTDEFFKTLSYRAEIERQAFSHAYDQVGSGAAQMDDVANMVREFMENPPTNAIKAADDYTKYVTFQNSLGPRGQRFQLALRSTPILSVLAPFVRTPVNIFTAGILDRSPIALFRGKFYEAMRAGGRERDMMLARVTMGSATSAVVASYVLDGTITGAGPSNPEARAILEKSGWQPYSIRVGDKYVSYARAEPLAFVIGATADAAEILSYINSDVEGLEDESEQVSNAIAAVIIGIANNTMSKTYVRGIADFTEMLSDPQRYFASWSRNMVPAFIPYSQFRRQAGQIQDPYLREAWSIMDAIKAGSGIPGYSESLPPRRDLFGEPRPVAAGDLLGPMSPFPSSLANDIDPVYNELRDLMETTRDIPLTMPAKRIEGMRLSPDEYDQLVLLSRTTPAPNGRRIYDEIARVINLPTYARATADMKVELIKSVQRNYDSIARAQLEREDPEFAAKIAEYRQRRNQLRFGEE